MESRLALPKDSLFVVSENKRARNTRYLVPKRTPPPRRRKGVPRSPRGVIRVSDAFLPKRMGHQPARISYTCSMGIR